MLFLNYLCHVTLTPGSDRCYSVQKPVCSCLLSKNIKTGDRDWVAEEGEGSQMFKLGSLCFVPLTAYYLGDKEDEVGGVCGTYGGDGRGEMHTEFWLRNLKERPFGIPRYRRENRVKIDINRLSPNDPYMGRTAPLNSKRCVLYIYSTNMGTEYFKHALYSAFFSLQNAVCFIMLTCLVPVLFTFYIQVC